MEDILTRNQLVVVLKDRRDEKDLHCNICGHTEQHLTNRILIYEGEYPWAVKFFDGKTWLYGIFDYGEYMSGELVTRNEIPMRNIYPIVPTEDGKFAHIISKARFRTRGNHKVKRVWEHEIDYKPIKKYQ